LQSLQTLDTTLDFGLWTPWTLGLIQNSEFRNQTFGWTFWMDFSDGRIFGTFGLWTFWTLDLLDGFGTFGTWDLWGFGSFGRTLWTWDRVGRLRWKDLWNFVWTPLDLSFGHFGPLWTFWNEACCLRGLVVCTCRVKKRKRGKKTKAKRKRREPKRLL
jgi:hypothetical protein